MVIGQEIFGVNANMRAVADLYAEEGYVALVPDLFWRLQPGVDLGYDEAAFAKAIELFQRIDLTPRWTTSPPVSSTCANARR